jgi:preprotein translocase subunit SecY
MLSTLKNAWRIPELRKRLIFTVCMLFVFRIGAFIPVPGVDAAKLQAMLSKNTFGSFIDIMTGGAFAYAAIFALGVTPYINSSIILQLLTVAIPALEKLNKEGQEGRKKIAEYTRYLTVVLAAIQAIGFYIGIVSYGLVTDPGILTGISVVLSFTAGSSFLMWVGEKITEKGVGNGMSLLIFTGIVSRIPKMINIVYQYNQQGTLNIFTTAVLVIAVIAIIAAIVFFDRAERKIPVQYPRRVVGRTTMGGQVSYMPIKVNIGNVIPIIFAISLFQIPQMITGIAKVSTRTRTILSYFSTDSYGAILYALLIVFFTYFYASIMFNVEEISENMKKNGAFIPGVRQGKSTSEFLSEVLSKVTFIGAMFLMTVALIPSVVTIFLNIKLSLTATSMLIMVGVALETVRQIEAQMSMKHYRGFLD